MPAASIRSAGVPVVVRHPVAGEQRPLAVDHDAAPGLVDVGGLADQPGVRHHLGLAAARHDHHLDPGAVAGLERPRLQQREVALGVAEQRAVVPEQGAVEVGVDAAQGHGGQRYRAHGRATLGAG